MKIETPTVFNKFPLFFAMMIIATGQVGVSIYLPALPVISEDFGVGQEGAQSLVSLFLIGFGLSQLFYGPLSDAIGRRPVFLWGQGLYLVGVLVCIVFSHDFNTLLFGRLLQGLGAGSASVLGRSILRDSYSGEALTRALTYLAVVASIMPILGPFIGGWITWHMGWQWVFGFVFIYLLTIYVLGWIILPETLPYPVRTFYPGRIMGDYWKLLNQSQVIFNASYNWLSYLAALVTLMLYPFLMQEQLGLTPASYGQLMIIPSAGLMIGSLLLTLLRRRVDHQGLLLFAIVLAGIAGIWLMMTPMTIFNLMAPFTILSISNGIIFPLATAKLLVPHGRQAGSVSALSGALQMAIAGILSGFLIEHLVKHGQSLGVFYLITSLIMVLVFFLSMSRKSLSPPVLIE